MRFDSAFLGIVEGFPADGLSLGLTYGFGMFGFLTVGWFLGFLVDFLCGSGYCISSCKHIFAVDFSAWALGAGFRPGASASRFPPP